MAQAPIKSASGSWVKSDVKLGGKTVLITGANTGIGLETAIDLAKRDANVILACRNLEKAELARERVVKDSGSQNVKVKELDLSSFESIRKFAEDINSTEERLDILINNAGVMLCPESETKDGFETQFGVNHLGHFLLTNLLLDLIKRSAPSRVVTVSSSAHMGGKINWDDLNYKKNYSARHAYSNSKLMNILFSRELCSRLEGTGVTSNSLHPGVVNTELWRHLKNPDGSVKSYFFLFISKFTWFLKTAEHGAQTSLYCTIAPELAEVSGKYFSDCKITRESNSAQDDEVAKKLWQISEELTGLTRTEGGSEDQKEE